MLCNPSIKTLNLLFPTIKTLNIKVEVKGMWTHDTNRSRGQLFELHFQTQVTKDTPKNTVTCLIILQEN